MDTQEQGKDRRKAENALLRELVDELKVFIASRDAIWNLSFFDRLFNKRKCEQIFKEYEQAAATVKVCIQDMAVINRDRQSAKLEPLISLEEFEALMSVPGSSSFSRKKSARGNGKQKKGPQPYSAQAQGMSTHLVSHLEPVSPKAENSRPVPSGGLSMLENPFERRRKLI